MRSKILWLLLMLSISAASIAVYDTFFVPKEVIIRERVTPQFTTLNDLRLGGELQRTFLASSPTDFTASAKQTMPAVTYIRASNQSGYDFWNSRAVASSGSGVIISPDGYIVTNNHVIEEGETIEVVLNDRREFTAELIGTDPTTDLALLKIEAEKLPYLFFGNSDSLQIGEWVLAVGNPFRLQSTVTAGIVSAKGRDINILDMQYGIESFIQTDAAVNPGNSGGALVNTNGELVGINTAIITYSGSYEGYSFAIPANLARKVIRDLKDYGTVHRGLLGIEASNISARQADELGLETVSGVIINRVSDESGAEDAGLRSGDVILRVNDKPIRSMPELQEQLGRHRPGDFVEVSYMRGRRVYQVEVQLKNQLNTTDLVSVRRDKMLTSLGLEVRNMIASELRQNKLQGVKVISIYKNSIISRTHMEPGYIITRIDDKRVKTAEEFMEMLKKTSGQIVLEGYYEKYEGPYWYAFEK